MEVLQIWKIRYGISEEAFHALLDVLSTVEQTSERQILSEHQRQSLHTSVGQPPLQTLLQGGEFISPHVEGGFIYTPNSAPNFPFDDPFWPNTFNDGNLLFPACETDIPPFLNSDGLTLSSNVLLTLTPPPLPKTLDSNLLDDFVLPAIQDTPRRAGSTALLGSKRSSAQRVHEPSTKKKKLTSQCLKCWYQKKSCDNVPSQCTRCASTNLPPQVCIRTRLANDPVFQKWKDESYSMKLRWPKLHWNEGSKSVTLQHEASGPHITLKTSEFCGSHTNDATRIYWKGGDGWHYVDTTLYGLQTPEMVDLSDYVAQYASFYMSRLTGDESYIGHILDEVKSCPRSDLMDQTLQLWTANRLLMRGWRLTGEEMLGMRPVDDESSPLYSTVPAPRVIQNQLDRNLELFIASTEEKIMRELQRVLHKRSAHNWEATCLVAILILHVLEQDSWRLLYWKYHRQECNNWRHPLSPQMLIEKNVLVCNMIVTYVRFASPFPEGLKSKLNKKLVPQYQYKEKDENSINGSFSCLMFDRSLNALASIEDFVLG